jgi:hypothetical protein
LADGLKEVQVRPTGGEADQNTTTTDTDFGRNFDEQQSPGGGLAFAQRIVPTTAREVATLFLRGPCFQRYVRCRGRALGRPLQRRRHDRRRRVVSAAGFGQGIHDRFVRGGWGGDYMAEKKTAARLLPRLMAW